MPKFFSRIFLQISKYETSLYGHLYLYFLNICYNFIFDDNYLTIGTTGGEGTMFLGGPVMQGAIPQPGVIGNPQHQNIMLYQQQQVSCNYLKKNLRLLLTVLS